MIINLEVIDLKRVRQVCFYLMSQGYADSMKELAPVLGYTAGTLSSILTGKRDLTIKFIENLLILDENVNKNYILKNEGKLYLDDLSDTIKQISKENKLYEELLEAKKQEILRLKEEIIKLKKG